MLKCKWESDRSHAVSLDLLYFFTSLQLLAFFVSSHFRYKRKISCLWDFALLGQHWSGLREWFASFACVYFSARFLDSFRDWWSLLPCYYHRRGEKPCLSFSTKASNGVKHHRAGTIGWQCIWGNFSLLLTRSCFLHTHTHILLWLSGYLAKNVEV